MPSAFRLTLIYPSGEPDELVRLAPRLRAYFCCTVPSWPDIVEAAHWLCHDLGVSKSLWGGARLVVGCKETAVARRNRWMQATEGGPTMAEAQRVALVIQRSGAVWRDTRANRAWIGWTAGLLATWTGLSSWLFYLAEYGQTSNGKPLTRWFDSLYFTVINVTTAGFGDITPQTDWGKVLAMLNALAGVTAFGLLVAVLAAAFQPGEVTEAGEAELQLLPQPKPSKVKPPEETARSVLHHLDALTRHLGEGRKGDHYRFRVTEGGGQGDQRVVEIVIGVWRG